MVGLPDWTVEFVLVDDHEMQELNRRFRNKDAVTDVLSFPELLATGDGPAHLPAACGEAFCDLWRDPLDGPGAVVGEIVMAPGFIEDRCQVSGWDPASEFLLLMVHGLLHLVGWDHPDGPSMQAMRERETGLLARRGLLHPMRDEKGE